MNTESIAIGDSPVRSETSPLQHLIAVGTRNPAATSAALLILSFVIYWIVFAYFIRGIHFDEGVSVLAARSILEHGYPQLPSEFVYHRAYLHHYLLAGSILLLGVTNIAVMLPAFFFAIGSLILVYILASRIAGMRWLGVATIAVLPILQVFSWYATSSRMYMALLFFTLLGTFFAWKGFVEGSKHYRVPTLVALTFGMLSHEQGIIAAIAIAGGVLVMLIIDGRLLTETKAALTSPPVLSLIVLMGLVAWFVHIWEPGTFRSIVLHDGDAPDRVGLNLNYVFWGMHLGRIEEAFPLALPFTLVGLTSIGLFKTRSGLKYLACTMIFSFAITGLVLKDGLGPRVFFFLMPLYTLFAVLGVVAIVRTIRSPSWPMAAVRVTVFIVGFGISTLLGTFLASGPYERRSSGAAYMMTAISEGLRPAALFDGGYGIPCGRRRYCTPEMNEGYERLKLIIGPDDVVVSSAAMHTSFHLARVDAWLRARLLEDGRLGAYEGPTDEYFGIPVIDTAEELAGLAQRRDVVWVIVHSSRRLSTELTEVLNAEYVQIGMGSALTVYRPSSD